MRMLRRWITLFAVLAIAAAATAQTAAMKSLKKADAALTSGMTLALDVSVDANPFDPAQGKETRAGRLTLRNHEWAFASASTYDTPPQFRAKGTPSYEPFDFDADGNLITWRTLRHNILSDATHNEALVLLRKEVVSSSGATVRKAEHTQLLRYRLGSEDSFPELDLILMAIGHGFTRSLDSANAVSAQQVEGKGRYGVLRGLWRLTLDPANAGLVREAVFTADGENTPTIDAKVDGTVHGEGIVVGKNGTVRVMAAGRVTNELSVHVNTARSGFDAALVKEVRTRVTAPLLTGAEIVDFTKSPTQRSFVTGVAAAATECDVASGKVECCSAQHCNGKVLNHKDPHNCKLSGGKSWHGEDGVCRTPPQ